MGRGLAPRYGMPRELSVRATLPVPVPHRWSTLALLVLCGCADATGSVSGGGPLFFSTSDASIGSDTWTDLYADFFGPAGQASCTAHDGLPWDRERVGARKSAASFAATPKTLAGGMTQGIPADAGGIFRRSCRPTQATRSKTPLFAALHAAASDEKRYALRR